jgi:adenylate cyclase
VAIAKANRRHFWRWLLLLPLPFVWLLCAQHGWLNFLENRLLDWRYHFRGEIPAPVSLRYVDLDTRGIQAIGEKPWNREKFGVVAQAMLERGHAKAVGFDFVFSSLSYSDLVDAGRADKGNWAFARVIHQHPEIVLAAQYTQGEGQLQEGLRNFPLLRLGFTDRTKNDLPELPQYPLIGPTWGTVGLIDVDYARGGDEVPRWVPLFAQTPNPTFLHMALQLALIELGLKSDAVKIFADRIDLVNPAGAVVRTIPLTVHQLVEINWFSRWKNEALNPRTSLADVLLYLDDLGSPDAGVRTAAENFFQQFAGAIVLIGPTDQLLQDLAPTPFDDAPVPKVGLHGNLLKTILSGRFLRRMPAWVNSAETLGLTFAVVTLAIAGGARGLRYKLFAFVVLVAFVAFGFVLFANYDLVLPMAAPLGAAFTTSFVAVAWQLIEEEKQKGRIKGMFGTYVSPALVHRMVESGEEPKLGGVEENITAYFSDIQAFSTFSEKLDPAHLVELMNEYLTACTDIVQAEGGTLDKYIGDAVVAIYGAPLALPDHAYRACVAALHVHRRVGELREKWKGEGGKWPEIVHKLQSRIGLNSGLCVVGNMGSHTRFNYTMMGDNVNLAARMESGAKSWGVYSMCAEATKLACEQHGGDRVVFRPLGKIVVMGRAQPVPVFEITDLKEAIPSQTRECLGLFAEGLAKYHARDWDGALAKFKESAGLEPNQPGKTPGVKSNPSLVYQEIVAQMKAAPPDEKWDGVYVMKEK